MASKTSISEIEKKALIISHEYINSLQGEQKDRLYNLMPKLEPIDIKSIVDIINERYNRYFQGVYNKKDNYFLRTENKPILIPKTIIYNHDSNTICGVNETTISNFQFFNEPFDKKTKKALIEIFKKLGYKNRRKMRNGVIMELSHDDILDDPYRFVNKLKIGNRFRPDGSEKKKIVLKVRNNSWGKSTLEDNKEYTVPFHDYDSLEQFLNFLGFYESFEKEKQEVLRWRWNSGYGKNTIELNQKVILPGIDIPLSFLEVEILNKGKTKPAKLEEKIDSFFEEFEVPKGNFVPLGYRGFNEFISFD